VHVLVCCFAILKTYAEHSIRAKTTGASQGKPEILQHKQRYMLWKLRSNPCSRNTGFTIVVQDYVFAYFFAILHESQYFW
jgi:hypothetical protein